MSDTNVPRKKIFPLDKDRALPFILTGLIILADQLTKFIIAKNWPRFSPATIIKEFFYNDLHVTSAALRFVHVRNPAIAFSLGRNVPESLRPILFVAIPLVVLGFLVWYYLKTTELSRLQRWAAAGIKYGYGIY